MAKKKQTMEELLEEALVPEEEQPYEVGSSWTWVKLGEIANIKRGASPRPKGDPKYFGGDIPWLKISDISSQGRYVYTTQDTVTNAGKEKSVWVEPNTIILSISASVGKTCINKVGVCIHDGFVQIKENETLIDKLYLYHYLISALNLMLSKAKGAAQVNINSTVVKELAIPLPPLNEQKRIADKVERLLNKIDEAKQLIEEAKESFELRRAAILDKAFRGELTKEWRRAHNMEQNWEKVLLESQVSKLGDGLHGTPKYSEDGKYYFINGNNFNGNSIFIKPSTKKVSKEEFEKHKKHLTKTTLFVSINGTLGKTAFYNGEPVILGKSACYINLNETLDKRFLRYYFHTKEFTNYAHNNATGSTIKNLSLKAMRKLSLNLPTIQEQHEIVKLLDSLLEEENKSKALFESIDINKLKQSILTKAFKGELGTNDPTEENAIELLKEVL